MQGTWRVISVEKDGKPFEEPDNPWKERPLTFSGDSAVSKERRGTDKGTFRLDEAKSPKAIDITSTQKDDAGNKDRVFHGIYRLEGSQQGILRICLLMEPNGKERPGDFSTKEGDDRILVVLERVDPKAEKDAKKGTQDKK